MCNIFKRLFILLAEHGSNCSTVTMRHLVSSGVDPYSALAGAFAALFGERKCHSVIDMLQQINGVDGIAAYLDKVKSKEVGVNGEKLKLQGFGHRVYKGKRDPRVAIARKLAYEAMEIKGGPGELAKIALQLEVRVSEDAYFVGRNLYANIDFWTAILLHTCGFPKGV
jgi:citrate synthase